MDRVGTCIETSYHLYPREIHVLKNLDIGDLIIMDDPVSSYTLKFMTIMDNEHITQGGISLTWGEVGGGDVEGFSPACPKVHANPSPRA